MRVPRLNTLRKRLRRAVRYELHARSRRMPLERGSILYESFSGNGMLCNPEAIFQAILDAPDLGHLTHIWALSDLQVYRATVQKYADLPNVRFVKYGSNAYYRALATSEFLVNNATFPPSFSKRPGQVYLNTWHGTPLKRMGYDIEDGALATANIIRNFVAADYLLAQNTFMTDQMYASAYKLTGIYRGSVIEEGYPRTDRQVLDEDEAHAARKQLADAGITADDRRIILYAPTWKGLAFNDPNDDIDQLLHHVEDLQRQVDGTRYRVLLKTHQIVHKLAAHRPDLRRILVPNELPTNVILGLTDVLITDYSSIFVDFLSTGRPVLFFTPDLEDYAGTRGLYFPPSEWPGPVSRTTEELASHIERYALTGDLPPESAERYRSMQGRFTRFDDGHSASRVVDIVFRGHHAGHRIRNGLLDDRTSILVYLGGMRPNGITTSVLNLLNSIDHNRFDVSAFFAQSKSPVAIAKQRAIEYSVRQFPRVGGMNGSKLTHLWRHLEFRRGRINRHREQPAQNALWDDEWTRCFGDSRFDYVVDFSGYGPFWSVLLLHSPDAVRSIWLHNDLAEDAHREVNGKKKMKRSLTSLFSLYPQFDHLVSVSPTLADINRAKLAAHASGEAFGFALNTVDADHILRGADAHLRNSTTDPETGETPSWVDNILAKDGSTIFVTVGRLSPEKNQARLIRAFAQVHAQHPLTKLVIVGDGPLREDLDHLTESLNLSESVILTGRQPNPHAIMVAADCFVLSSDYEGQPMVILEALVLGLPVVTVDFGSAQNALPRNSGLVVPQTVGGLVHGMNVFLRGEVLPAAFDYEAYNRKAIRQFYEAIGTVAAAEAELSA
jgi:CDP-glycerol glycerophosphotransferase